MSLLSHWELDLLAVCSPSLIPSKQHRLPALICITEPQVLKHVWTKSQREKIQKDLNSSKWSQTILFDNIPQVLWRSHNGQVYSVKGSWQIVMNQLLSHQTLSRDAFLFALKDGRLSAIHLLGSHIFTQSNLDWFTWRSQGSESGRNTIYLGLGHSQPHFHWIY